MREIKYRQPIWIKGEFAYWHYWGFISDGHFASPETNSNPIQKAHEESQQFTGLHDKNRKEIYEGDIVKWYVNDVVRTGIVEYLAGSYDLRNITDQYHVCNDWYRGEYEVVGNIYENPELLT